MVAIAQPRIYTAGSELKFLCSSMHLSQVQTQGRGMKDDVAE
jgi:hypothetical protein